MKEKIIGPVPKKSAYKFWMHSRETREIFKWKMACEIV